jgi:hypothetical protein
MALDEIGIGDEAGEAAYSRRQRVQPLGAQILGLADEEIGLKLQHGLGCRRQDAVIDAAG